MRWVQYFLAWREARRGQRELERYLRKQGPPTDVRK